MQNDNRTPRDRVDDDFRRFLMDEDGAARGTEYRENVRRADDAVFAGKTYPSFETADYPRTEGRTACPCTEARTAPVTVRKMPSCAQTNGASRFNDCPCTTQTNGAPRSNGFPCTSQNGAVGISRTAFPNPRRGGRCMCTGLSPERIARMNDCGCPMPAPGKNIVDDTALDAFPLAMVYAPRQEFGGIKESCCAFKAGTVFDALDLPFDHAKTVRGTMR